MRIVRARGIDGANAARGTAVVIDVLRAFTTAAYALAPAATGAEPLDPPATSPPTPGGRTHGARAGHGKTGAREIWLVATPAEALALKSARPELVLVGEVGGKPIPGFDHGNSPERMSELGAELSGCTVVLRSSSGVQGALAAVARAEHLLLGSLVTASATVRAARSLGEDVTLVAMGSPEGPDGPEDEACADLLEALLRGERPDLERIVWKVRLSPAARQALDPALDWITPGDLECALAIDRFDFAVAAQREGERLIARAFMPGKG